MVFAHLRRRFAEQDWFAVAIELTTVGVGVFLGLQATAWNEDRLDRARAVSYRARLIEDLRAAVADVRAAPGLAQDLTGTLTELDSKVLNFGKIAIAAREMRVELARAAR